MEKIDHIPKGYKLFELRAAGKKYVAKKNSCLFCKYCTDIYWDYTNGIYSIVCDKEKSIDNGIAGKCAYFRYGSDYV